MSRKILIAYIPAIHQGYRKLLEANEEYRTLYILSNDIVDSFRPLQKDLRRLDPTLVRQSLIVWNILDEIKIAGPEELEQFKSMDIDILMPDEDVSRDVAKQYFPDKSIQYFPIFLRWDRHSSNAEDPIDPDATVSTSQLDTELMKAADNEANHSSDIWRRVGALIARDGKIISKSYNQAMPTPHASWMYGDPRNNYGKGENIDKSVFIHAEALLIAEAAQKGTKLAGADMYVTTFPCPQCAMLIANAGIKRLYFTQGYASLEGKSTLKSRKVELIQVITELKTENPAVLVPYPEK